MPLFDVTHVALEQAMRGSSMRQEALSQNLANVSTPGYQRKDVDFHGTLQALMASGPDASTLKTASFAVQPDASAQAVRPDGGTVDVDRESAQLAANGLEYSTLASVMRARLDILQSAMTVR